ncbi:hypothetical protein ACLQ90_09655 [Avibacterium paragallinarum]|uniref:Defence against restriction A N-terminal domain-containing protein n=1 Tax=Avibacterium paragallinarum TaxID=728 RepID=A0AAE5THH5_AVIPA|nr:hypothetical protein [Avibacterium paragallinarum]MEE3608283.1 hypothetical protein [Avibacterium paragallinarum]MEE3620794.1 hypothetical protein [Avibacterium paragallinarum]MEE3668095.1 hypothetical protein [Avibacterium paragallinarum]MEE3681367.1 hypothetical protein [Avibacterium paragallinarum]MEE4385899.1 hypothetical protein [Avibacterium paragallinarum]
MALNLTFWDNQQNPVNTTVEQLFDALRNDDMKAGLMYEPCTMDDVLDGTEPSNALIMDAIIAQYAKLTAKMNIMQRVMSRSGVDVKDSEGKTVPLTVVGYQISDPFMRLGTANVVALFELSDGQTVSIYFHNPDTTPKKITPQDEVISFKWLLNKKDITIVVAPEKGKDIDVRQVALRIMKIAAKNSDAFARQNKNRKERLERVNTLRTRVAEKEKILAQKLKKIDELQYLKAQEEVDQLLEDERLMNSELNASLYAELKALDRLSDREDELDNIYQARVVAVRNMLRDKGWKGESYKELSKEGYVLTETYHYSKSGTNMIGVTYSIPELNLSYTDELTDTPEAIAEMINEPVDKALKALRLSQVASDKEEDKEQPIAISGKEFGEFDTETEEGKKALRSKVLEHLTETLKGKWVKNLFLDRDIEIRKRGIKKTLANSANPLKLKALAQLEEIIKTAKGSKDYIQDNFKSDKKPNVLRYFHLENHVLVDNRPLKINVVIEEDTNGLLHYDLTLEKNKVALDSIEPFLNTIPGTFNAKSATGNSIENLEGECNSKDGFDAIMDSIEMKKVGSYEANKSSVSNLYQAQSSELLLDNIAILDGKQVEDVNGFMLLDDTQQANLMIALNYAATLDEGVVIDATQLAQDQLEAALSVLENNLPINEQEGNIAQAELERDHIASIKEALSVLQSQPALDGVDDDGYVLNLFVEYKDENGNWVELKDEDEEVEPENSNAQPETIQSNPVLLHTSLLYKGEGYRPFLPGRDEEIEQFKQAGYMLEPFSVEGRSCTYSVHKTAEPYNIHITANWYSDGEKSYWINVSPQKGYVTDVKENNGGQAKVAGANENAKSVTEAIQLAEELIQEEKHYRPLRKEKGYISGTYFATKGRSKTYFFNVSQNLETLKYSAYIQWSSGEPKEMTFDSLDELKEGVENYFRAYVKGTLPEITLSSGTDILEINANKEDQETTVESEQSNAVGETLPELVLPKNANREMLNAIAQDYLKAHLQGKRIKTSDGKIVHFNRDQSVKHFSFNAQVGELETKALTKIAEVFSQGIFVGREETYKERKDKFVAFHVYQKQVEIDGMKLLLQTKAGEKENGELEVAGKLIGYTHKLLDNAESNSDDAPPVLTSPNGERPSEGYATADNKGTLFLDETQEETADYLVEILEIRDKDGNLIDLAQLGAEQGNAIENNVEENLPELVLPENASRKELGKTVQNWLKANLQGKVITASDGNKIHFNRNDSVEHLTSDGRKGKLEALVISKIAEVFQTGEAKGREELVKPREDFVAFYRYDKWLELDGYRVQVVAKAGERTDGALESLTKLVAYSGAIYNKATLDSSYSLGLPKQALPAADLSNSGLSVNTSTILDNAQEDEPLATLTILEIRDKNGNLIDLDQLEAEEGSSMENNVEENAQKQADIQFLQDVIEGNVNVFDATFNAKLSEIASRLQSSNIELVQQAANAYVSKMTEKARQA